MSEAWSESFSPSAKFLTPMEIKAVKDLAQDNLSESFAFTPSSHSHPAFDESSTNDGFSIPVYTSTLQVPSPVHTTAAFASPIPHRQHQCDQVSLLGKMLLQQPMNGNERSSVNNTNWTK
jgi:hypothetical protein